MRVNISHIRCGKKIYAVEILEENMYDLSHGLEKHGSWNDRVKRQQSVLKKGNAHDRKRKNDRRAAVRSQ